MTARREGVPTTSAIRTLLDVAAVAPPYRVEQALEDVLRKRYFTVDQIVQRFVQIATPGPRRDQGDASAPVGADRRLHPDGERALELATAKLIEAAGLPEPTRQIPVSLTECTVFVDTGWPEVMLGIECDGLWTHGTNLQLPWDADRQNQLVLLGWLILRFSSRAIERNPDQVISQLKRAYRSTRSNAGRHARIGDPPSVLSFSLRRAFAAPHQPAPPIRPHHRPTTPERNQRRRLADGWVSGCGRRWCRRRCRASRGAGG